MQFKVNVVINPQTNTAKHPQTGPITIPQPACSVIRKLQSYKPKNPVC